MMLSDLAAERVIKVETPDEETTPPWPLPSSDPYTICSPSISCPATATWDSSAGASTAATDRLLRAVGAGRRGDPQLPPPVLWIGRGFSTSAMHELTPPPGHPVHLIRPPQPRIQPLIHRRCGLFNCNKVSGGGEKLWASFAAARGPDPDDPGFASKGRKGTEQCGGDAAVERVFVNYGK